MDGCSRQQGGHVRGSGFDQAATGGAAKGGEQTASEAADASAATVTKTIVRDQPKVGRNDPCPCGSGKKYKKCHGANVA